MGGSLEFHELLTKKKTIGEWGLEEELTPVIDKLVERDALLKLMDSALKYIRDETTPYDFHTLVLLRRHVESIAVGVIISRIKDYVDPDRAVIKALEYIVASILHETLHIYNELLEEKEEWRKEKLHEDIGEYASLLKEYAERYPDETTRGLIKFIDYVADAVEEVKEEISKYGHPLV